MKMRKVNVVRVLCFVLVTIMLMSMAGCGAGSDTASLNGPPAVGSPAPETTAPSGHEHLYSESVVNATCKDGGYVLYECECGESYKANETAALGHKYEEKVVEPTGSEQGYTLYTCSVCGDNYKSDQKDNTDSNTPGNNPSGNNTSTPSDHTHKHTASVTKPTCTEKGYTEHTCSCGDSYKDTYVNATGHSWGEWKTTKEPTTSAAGQKTRTCSKCSSTENQSINKLPVEESPDPATCKHNWKSNYYPEVGHYTDYYVVCICGYKCANTSAWISHSKSFSGEEQLLYHGSNATGQDYIIDSPGRWEWTCTKCGAVSSTKP